MSHLCKSHCLHLVHGEHVDADQRPTDGTALMRCCNCKMLTDKCMDDMYEALAAANGRHKERK